MQTNTDTKLAQLVSQLMQESVPEKPTPDFTANLMTQVWKYQSGKITDPKPIISKTGWFLIAAAIFGLLLLVLLNEQPSGGNSYGLDIYANLYRGVAQKMRGYRFSAVSLYAVGCLTLLFLLQVGLLKIRHEKQFHL